MCSRFSTPARARPFVTAILPSCVFIHDPRAQGRQDAWLYAGSHMSCAYHSSDSAFFFPDLPRDPDSMVRKKRRAMQKNGSASWVSAKTRCCEIPAMRAVNRIAIHSLLAWSSRPFSSLSASPRLRSCPSLRPLEAPQGVSDVRPRSGHVQCGGPCRQVRGNRNFLCHDLFRRAEIPSCAPVGICPF